MILGHVPIPDPVITAQCGGCEFAGYGVHACGAGEVGSAPAELHSLRVMEGEDPLEKEMATHSSNLPSRIPMDRGAW